MSSTSDYERGIRDAIRWRMTHIERFSADAGEPRTEDGYYRIAMVPDRTEPGELLTGSADYRERMIGIVSDFAVAALASPNRRGMKR